MTTTAPGGSSTPAGGTCVPCTTGTVKVQTKSLAVCWDTGPDGVDAEDQPLGGVNVRLVATAGSSPAGQTTGSGPASEGGDDKPLGEVEFAAVTPGEYEVRVSKSGYDAPRTAARVTVAATSTADASVSLRRRGLECNRKHPASAGINDGPSIWLPVFWIPWGEPWILILRDTLWLTATVFTVLGLVMKDLSVTAFAGVFTALLSVVIFGVELGVVLLISAFAAFFMMILVAASAGVMSALGGPSVLPPLAGMTAGTWIAFLLALAVGRQDEYTTSSVMAFSIAPAVFALIVSIAVTAILHGSAGMVVLAAILGAVAGFVSGMLGHVFTNEGQTEAQHFKTGLHLPFAGERYCVQGLRGMISHFGWQEFCNDFAIEEGDPVLCAKDGHLIAYKEDRDGTEAFDGNSIANYVKVKHEDGSVAHYLHGKKGGVTSINPSLSAEATSAGSGEDAYNEVSVYVQAGQHLCEAGNVGISMFSHIHFTVRRGPTDPNNGGPAANYIPPKFDDMDVARHDGRCWAMRKYKSDNVNKGPIEFPPDEGALYP
jgi:hypothetical protein